MSPKHFNVELVFETARPLSQSAGLEMWSLGSYFTRVAPKTYKLKSSGDAVTISAAQNGLIEAVEAIVRDQLPAWPGIRVEKITAKEVTT